MGASIRWISFGSLKSSMKSVAQIGTPARRNDQKVLSLRTGGSPAGRGEHIGPHIEHRQEKVAAQYRAKKRPRVPS